jgi:hypothetical protein
MGGRHGCHVTSLESRPLNTGSGLLVTRTLDALTLSRDRDMKHDRRTVIATGGACNAPRQRHTAGIDSVWCACPFGLLIAQRCPIPRTFQISRNGRIESGPAVIASCRLRVIDRRCAAAVLRAARSPTRPVATIRFGADRICTRTYPRTAAGTDTGGASRSGADHPQRHLARTVRPERRRDRNHRVEHRRCSTAPGHDRCHRPNRPSAVAPARRRHSRDGRTGEADRDLLRCDGHASGHDRQVDRRAGQSPVQLAGAAARFGRARTAGLHHVSARGRKCHNGDRAASNYRATVAETWTGRW